MELSLSFFSLESLKIILKMCSMSKSGKISRLSPLLTPYVTRTPKTRFLCYSNKYPFIKLFIFHNRTPANIRISSEGWPILCKNSSTSMPLWHNKDKSENPCVATGWRFVLILFPLKTALKWGLREGVKN